MGVVVKGKNKAVNVQDEIRATRSGRIDRPSARFREFGAITSFENDKMLMIEEDGIIKSTEEL